MSLLESLKKGDKVICEHRTVSYVAKVCKIDQGEGKVRVHYQGWKARWDEWVETDRLKEFNEKNLEEANAMQNIMSWKCKKKKKAIASAVESTSKDSRGKCPVPGLPARKLPGKSFRTKFRGPDLRERSSGLTRARRNETTEGQLVIIPPSLLQVLLEDFNAISVLKKWLKVPLRYNVIEICEQYIKHIRLEQTLDEGECLSEAAIGNYKGFGEALPAIVDDIYERDACLLYDAEKQSFDSAVNSLPADSKVSSILGVAHLLRLLMKCGSCRETSVFIKQPRSEAAISIEVVSHFMQFLVKYNWCFFNADEDYCDMTPPPS